MKEQTFRRSIRVACSNAKDLLLWLSVAAGLVLSVMSVLDICTDTCSEAHSYTIFGMDLGWFGTAFFSFGLALLGLRSRSVIAERAFMLLMLASAGAEFNFIRVQKYEIGSWCPICLAIAAAVFCAVFVLFYEKVTYFSSLGGGMKNYLKHLALGITALAVGLSGAFFGMKTEAVASGFDPYLGRKNSATIIYFISDWFCPGCRRIETRIEKIAREVGKTARIGFIDYQVYEGTSNFTPYNLQFLVYEKDKYFTLRRTLIELARKTRTPTNEEVQAAVEPCGVRLRQMNFTDVVAWMKMSDSVCRDFGIRATPSMVVTNTKTGKKRILVGGEITLEAIKNAMAQMGG